MTVKAGYDGKIQRAWHLQYGLLIWAGCGIRESHAREAKQE